MKDTIYREDAIGACAYETIECYEARKAIRALPSADRPPKVIAQITFDEEKLREIVKEAVESFKEEYEIADRPQGYWTKTDVATYRCSVCGKIQIADDSNELNYCCCCGSRNKVRRVKGADDD